MNTNCSKFVDVKSMSFKNLKHYIWN